MKKMHILLCNDDGINAPGLRALWEAVSQLENVKISIIAPAIEKSGSGSSITWDKPILIEESDWGPTTQAWAIDGTPADCIKMGTTLLLKETPHLILSGINAGSNAGRNVLHSGTIGAIIEGVLRNIPGMALSCENCQEPNYHVAQKYILQLIDYILKNPLQPGSFLNVNFPHAAKDVVKGFRLTRQGKGRWSEKPVFHLETKKGPTYFLGGKPEEVDEISDCDITLLKEGYMTAVPIHVHALTDEKELIERQQNFERFFVVENKDMK